MKLNVAAGARPLAGYINSDITPQAADIARVDVLELTDTYGQGVADEVRADWLVCHLTVPEFEQFLRQAFDVLAPGGIISLVDGDMQAWVQWCFRKDDWDMMHDILYSRQINGQHDYHKQGIYKKKMEHMLTAAGFTVLNMTTDKNYEKKMLDLHVIARKGTA